MPQVEIREVKAATIASVRRPASRAELPTVVPHALGVVWEFLRRTGVKGHGRNVALYWNCDSVECGVEVPDGFVGDGEVVPSATPAGQAVGVTHVGDYRRLGEAHDAVHRFAADNGLTLVRPCWEVYGHWVEDPEKVTTEVLYLLG